eukprot:6401087-Amphidinium_carterae.2
MHTLSANQLQQAQPTELSSEVHVMIIPRLLLEKAFWPLDRAPSMNERLYGARPVLVQQNKPHICKPHTRPKHPPKNLNDWASFCNRMPRLFDITLRHPMELQTHAWVDF